MKIKESTSKAIKTFGKNTWRTTRKIEKIGKKKKNNKFISRKIVKQGRRPVLDLRARPEREVPVKQHGFKQGEISHTTILGQ